MRVVVDGTKISCYVNGIKTQEYTAASTAGQIGLRVYNSETLFDNLVVYLGAIAPPVGGESAVPFMFPAEAPLILNNEDPAYSETTGSWDTVSDIGQDGSDSQVAALGGTAGFSTYPPATGNYKVEWFVPAAGGEAIDFTINTLDGMWKFNLPADSTAGWHQLGIVTATAGTAFELAASSTGLLYADAVRLTGVTDAASPVYTPTGGDRPKLPCL